MYELLNLLKANSAREQAVLAGVDLGTSYMAVAVVDEEGNPQQRYALLKWSETGWWLIMSVL